MEGLRLQGGPKTDRMVVTRSTAQIAIADEVGSGAHFQQSKAGVENGAHFQRSDTCFNAENLQLGIRAGDEIGREGALSDLGQGRQTLEVEPTFNGAILVSTQKTCSWESGQEPKLGGRELYRI